MEHFAKYSIRFLAVITLSFVMSGCRSKDPNPELKDPIFQSLKKEADDAERAFKEAETAKDEAYKAFQSATAQTIELKEAEKEYWKAVKRVDSLRPTVRYLKIRTERRKVEARAAYAAAFARGEEANWPNPEEFEAYQTNKRLREASLNWNRRVPKLQDRIPTSKSD